MRKFLFLLCTLLGTVGAWAEDLTDPLFASTSDNVVNYHIRCRNGYYFDSNTSPTQTEANYGQFAFYKVDGVDKAYYIKCTDTNKWLTYDNTQTGTDGKGFVTFSDTQGNYFIMEGSSQSNNYSFRIRPVNENDEANNFLNWYGGEGNYTQTIGLWNSSGGNNVHYMLELVGAETVTDKDNIANNKYYFISSVRGTMTLNTANTATISDRTDDGKTIKADADPEASKWAIVTYKDNKYLYNLKAKKFLGSGSNLAADITDATAMTLADLTNTAGERLFKFTQSSSTWINNNNTGNFGLIAYNSEDNGNKLRIREAGDIDDIGTVASLSDIRNDRLYTLTSARGGVVKRTDEAGICSSTNTTDGSTAVGADLWALLTFGGNKYFYNISAHKFLRANNSLGTYANATNDAMTMEDASSPSGDYKFTVKNGSNYLNNNDAGSVALDSWSTEDGGNRLDIVSVCEFDPSTIASDVTYDIYYNNEQKASGTFVMLKDVAPYVPSELDRAFIIYDYNGVTTITGNQAIRVDATWDGPFQLPATYASITKWYDMAVRSNWYVTSDNVDDDGALKTIEANALGLAEDAYQWAFVGDPWHVKIYNKAKGNTKVFTWVDGSNAIPTFVDASSENYWAIVRGTRTGTEYANSFMLTIPGTTYRQLNQNGGAGGPLKFWTNGTTSDAGSAFRVFDVPDDFHEYAVAEVKPYATATGYFAFTDAVKANIGWQDSYDTTCPFETYKSMKLALEAIDMTDLSNFVLPETGYYRFKNKTSQQYMVLEGPELYANKAANDGASTIAYLENGNGGNYSIKMQGLYLQPTSEDSQLIPFSTTSAVFTVTVPELGYGEFSNNGATFSYLHYKDNGKVVGWNANAEASKWTIEDADDFDLTIGDAGYSTLWVPFAVTIPDNVEVYTGSLNGEYLRLNEIEGQTIPANTAVILKGSATTYNFDITTGGSAIDGNVLQGSKGNVTGDGSTIFALASKNDVVGFYPVGDITIPANKAYLEYTGSGNNNVKGFTFVFEEEPDRIQTLSDSPLKGENIYNLAGQRLGKMQKGINIVNGKKIMK